MAFRDSKCEGGFIGFETARSARYTSGMRIIRTHHVRELQWPQTAPYSEPEGISVQESNQVEDEARYRPRSTQWRYGCQLGSDKNFAGEVPGAPIRLHNSMVP